MRHARVYKIYIHIILILKHFSDFLVKFYLTKREIKLRKQIPYIYFVIDRQFGAYKRLVFFTLNTYVSVFDWIFLINIQYN